MLEIIYGIVEKFKQILYYSGEMAHVVARFLNLYANKMIQQIFSALAAGAFTLSGISPHRLQ